MNIFTEIAITPILLIFCLAYCMSRPITAPRLISTLLARQQRLYVFNWWTLPSYINLLKICEFSKLVFTVIAFARMLLTFCDDTVNVGLFLAKLINLLIIYRISQSIFCKIFPFNGNPILCSRCYLLSLELN